jgi:hypothetical protein
LLVSLISCVPFGLSDPGVFRQKPLQRFRDLPTGRTQAGQRLKSIAFRDEGVNGPETS